MTPLRKTTLAIARYLLLVGACLATGLALFVAIENWRGNRAWRGYLAEQVARGDDPTRLVERGRRVPDEQNLFKAPTFAILLYERPGDAERRKLVESLRLSRYHALGRYDGTRQSMQAVRDELKRVPGLLEGGGDSAAQDILKALQPLDGVLDELAEAARVRPLAALEPLPVGSFGPMVDADGVFKLGQALGVRAAATLETGHAERAFTDVFTLQRLANGLTDRPATLLNLLVGVAMQGKAAEVIADGLQRNAWNETQLATFERLLGEVRPMAGVRDALRNERAHVVRIIDTQPAALGERVPWPWWLFHGWRQQNKVSYCRQMGTQILPRIVPEPEARLRPATVAAAEKVSVPRLRSPYTWVVDLALTNLQKIPQGVARSGDRLRLHEIACALARYRLARSSYPESLTALVPGYVARLPVEVVSGQPMQYQVLADGRARVEFGNAQGSGAEEAEVLRIDLPKL